MRIFVSSVITGFEEYRAAARRAVELLGFNPVMAEDLPAQSMTPQQACLEGVRMSDLYVGVLGRRYGTPAASGRSPTEEEFEEARSLSKPVLVFATREGMEEAQVAFLDRIRNWDEGVLYARFETQEQLKDEITRALAGRISPRRVTSPGVAGEMLGELLGYVDQIDSDVIVGLAVVPDLAQPLVELSQIDELATQVSKAAQALPGFVGEFRTLAKEHSAEAHVGDYRREATLEVFDDGRMVSVLPLTADRRDLASGFIIDAQSTQSSLAAMIETFDKTLAWLDRRSVVSRVYLHGRLKGVRMKTFADLPAEPITSIEVPSHDLPDPMPFPSQALELGRLRLRQADEVAVTLRGTIARLFTSAIEGRRR